MNGFKDIKLITQIVTSVQISNSIFSLCFKPFTINLRPKDFIIYSTTHSQPIGLVLRGRSIKTQLLLNNIESISSLIAFTIESYIFSEVQNFQKLQDHFPQRIPWIFNQDYTFITFNKVNRSFTRNKIWIKILFISQTFTPPLFTW